MRVRSSGEKIVEFQGGNRIHEARVDPQDRLKGFKVRGYNAEKKRYSRWKVITDPTSPKVQAWIDKFWLKYCKTPRAEVAAQTLKALEAQAAERKKR